MERYSQQRREPDVITVCQAFGAGTAGDVVRRTNASPSDSTFSEVRLAVAAIDASSRGPLGIVVSALDGTAAYGAGDWIRVLWSGLVDTTPVGAPAAGDPAYLTDAGIVTEVPGTFRRQVGVYRSPAGTVDFNGLTESRLEDAVTAVGSSDQNLYLLNGLRSAVSTVPLAGGASVALDVNKLLHVVNWTGGAGALTVDLPIAPAGGEVYIIKDGSGTAAGNNVIVNGNGNPVDLAGTYVIATNHGCVTVYCPPGGTAWYIIGKVV